MKAKTDLLDNLLKLENLQESQSGYDPKYTAQEVEQNLSAHRRLEG